MVDIGKDFDGLRRRGNFNSLALHESAGHDKSCSLSRLSFSV